MNYTKTINEIKPVESRQESRGVRGNLWLSLPDKYFLHSPGRFQSQSRKVLELRPLYLSVVPVEIGQLQAGRGAVCGLREHFGWKNNYFMRLKSHRAWGSGHY